MHFITNSYLFVSTLNVLCGKLCACMCVWGVRAITYVCVCVCVCVCITTGYCKSHVVALMFVIFCQNLSHEGAFQPWKDKPCLGVLPQK